MIRFCLKKCDRFFLSKKQTQIFSFDTTELQLETLQCSLVILAFNCIKRQNDLSPEQNNFGCKLLLPKTLNRKYIKRLSLLISKI